MIESWTVPGHGPYSSDIRREGEAMSKRKRTLIAVVVVELGLGLLWYYLHMEAVSQAGWAPDVPERIGRVMGGAMGILLGLTPLLYLMARRNDLKDADGQRSEG
jgi:hypothetical protein